MTSLGVCARAPSAGSPAAPSALSVELKQRTGHAHLAVEVSLALEIRLSDVRSYGNLLTALHGFYGPVEAALGVVHGWDRLTPAIDVSLRRRTALLDEDLGHLGLQLPRRPVATTSDLPALGSLARGLGCLYVLEGSALGGRIVARRARAALGDQLPVAFFSTSDRQDLKSDWKALLLALDSAGELLGDRAGGQAVAAAGETFAALGAWLELTAPTG